MIAPLRRFGEWIRGSGDYAVTVPPMDEALRPNRLIEEADLVLSVPAPDNLVEAGGQVLYSSGPAVFALDPAGRSSSELHRFDADISALALAPDGVLAIGLSSGRVVIRGCDGESRTLNGLGGTRSVSPVALLFGSGGELFVAQGSSENPPERWKHDLMERRRAGSVWRVDLTSGQATCLADRLGWPYGLALTGNGLAVSESWRHRLVLVEPGGGMRPVMEDLPGYPGRLSPARGGGYWLSVFAPRSQLIEFVLRENEFRRRMMADIDPAYWAAPSLSASNTFLEPLQGGAQKHLGMLKPWAPTRSYGLVVRLDGAMRPLASLHSRADGTRHGVASAVEAGEHLLIAAKGGDAIVAADPDAAVPARAAAAVGAGD